MDKKFFPEVKSVFLCKKCNEQQIASNKSFNAFVLKHLDKCGPQNIFFKNGELMMNELTDLQKVIKIMQVLEKDDLLLEKLRNVLLFEHGNPNVPYSAPFIPKSLRIKDLADYLNHPKLSLNEDGDKVKIKGE